MLYKIKPSAQPKWHQFRWRLSNTVVEIARRIKPDNPEVWAFYAKLACDAAIYGRTIVRINPEEEVCKESTQH